MTEWQSVGLASEMRLVKGATASRMNSSGVNNRLAMNNFRSDPMSPKTDLAITNAVGEPVLAVETKALVGKSPQWAAQYRNNLLSHGIALRAPNFLLAMPDRWYLWTPREHDAMDRLPDYDIDATPLLSMYFQGAGLAPDKIHSASFEMMVEAWFDSLLGGEKLSEGIRAAHPWLSELLDALKGGWLVPEDVA